MLGRLWEDKIMRNPIQYYSSGEKDQANKPKGTMIYNLTKGRRHFDPSYVFFMVDLRLFAQIVCINKLSCLIESNLMSLYFFFFYLFKAVMCFWKVHFWQRFYKQLFWNECETCFKIIPLRTGWTKTWLLNKL
jgi:hypothetical protein